MSAHAALGLMPDDGHARHKNRSEDQRHRVRQRPAGMNSHPVSRLLQVEPRAEEEMRQGLTCRRGGRLHWMRRRLQVE